MQTVSKKMRRMIVLAAAVTSVGIAAAKTSQWSGDPSLDGTADWNADANWSEGAPTGDDTAVLVSGASPSAQRAILRLTPPTSFTGAITVGTESVKTVSDAGRALLLRAQLTVPEGAAWTVGGQAILIATDGIADRLTSDFTGVIEVRKGTSFAVPANLSTAVTFMGDGEIVLDSSDRIAQTHGFVGTVKFAGETLSSSEVTDVMQRSLALGDGQTLDLSEHMLSMGGVTPMKGFDESEAWAFNATTWTEGPFEQKFGTAFPTYDAEGGIRLVDDPAQHRIVVYKERSFSIADTWGVRFTWVPDLPADSRFVAAGWGQQRSGHFSILMQSSGPNLVPSGNTEPLNAFSYGFDLDCYDEWGGNGIMCLAGWYERWYRVNPFEFQIDYTKPVDVSAAFDKGILTVTYMQDGKSFSFCRDWTRILQQEATRLWLTFDAASDYNGQNNRVYWMTQSVRNFRGWYRNPTEGPWTLSSKDGGFNPINEKNWKITNLDKRDENNVITNNPANELANGDYHLQDNVVSFSVLHSYAQFDVNRRWRVTFDLDFGDTGWYNAGAIAMGFVEWPADNWMEAINEWNNMAFNGGWERCWLATWQYYIDNRYVRLWQGRRNDDGQEDAFESPVGSVPTSAQSVSHIDMIYDPAGTLDWCLWQTNKSSQGSAFQIQKQSVSAAAQDVFREYLKNNMQFLFKSQGPFQAMTLRNFHVYEMNDNGNEVLGTSISVADGASSALTVGAPAAASETPAATLDEVSIGSAAGLTVSATTTAAALNVKRVEARGVTNLTVTEGASVGGISEISFVGDDAALAAQGSVACSDALTVIVPRSWVRAHVIRTLVTGVTLPSVTAVRVVADDGADLTERSHVQIKDGNLSVNFTKGAYILVL